MTSISSGTPTSTSSPSWTDVLSRIADTRRKDTIAPAKRAVTSITLPTWSRSLVPMAMTSPVLTLRGSEPPRRTVWRVTTWTTRYDAVSQLVTAKRCRMIPVKACRRPMANMTLAQNTSRSWSRAATPWSIARPSTAGSTAWQDIQMMPKAMPPRRVCHWPFASHHRNRRGDR